MRNQPGYPARPASRTDLPAVPDGPAPGTPYPEPVTAAHDPHISPDEIADVRREAANTKPANTTTHTLLLQALDDLEGAYARINVSYQRLDDEADRIKRLNAEAKLLAQRNADLRRVLAQITDLADRWHRDRTAFPDGAAPILDDIDAIIAAADLQEDGDSR